MERLRKSSFFIVAKRSAFELTLACCPNWCFNSSVMATESVKRIVTKRLINSNVTSSEVLSMLRLEHDGAIDSVSDLCHIFTSKESKLPSQRLKLSPLSLVAVEQLVGGMPSKLFSFVVNVFGFLPLFSGWWLIVVALQSIWCLWFWLSTTIAGDTGWRLRGLSTWKLSVIMVQSVTSKWMDGGEALALRLMLENEWVWRVMMLKSDHNPFYRICVVNNFSFRSDGDGKKADEKRENLDGEETIRIRDFFLALKMLRKRR